MGFFYLSYLLPYARIARPLFFHNIPTKFGFLVFSFLRLDTLPAGTSTIVGGLTGDGFLDPLLLEGVDIVVLTLWAGGVLGALNHHRVMRWYELI